jgi:nucleotide-binding universal stress UspA family protein
MNNTKFILACTNGLPPSDAVCDYAVWLSRNSSGKLKLLHALSKKNKVTETNLSGSLNLGARSELLNKLVEEEHLKNKKRQQKGKEILAEAKKRAEKLGAKELETCLRNGRLVDTLLDFQEETEITVIGRYGRLHQGEKSIGALGHHVEDIIRTINTPVMVIGKTYQKPKSALFAYNGSSAAKKALNYITTSGIFNELNIHIVSVGKNQQVLNEAKQQLTKSNIKSTVSSLSGDPQATIKNYADVNEIDLIIMGAYGHNRLKAFLFGSFTNKMLAQCDKATLLLR